MGTPATQGNDLRTIYRMASYLGATPNRLRREADRLGIKPALRLNDQEYFDERQQEQLAEAVRPAPMSEPRRAQG